MKKILIFVTFVTLIAVNSFAGYQGAGDDLGNHIATQKLDMVTYAIMVGTIEARGTDHIIVSTPVVCRGNFSVMRGSWVIIYDADNGSYMRMRKDTNSYIESDGGKLYLSPAGFDVVIYSPGSTCRLSIYDSDANSKIISQHNGTHGSMDCDTGDFEIETAGSIITTPGGNDLYRSTDTIAGHQMQGYTRMDDLTEAQLKATTPDGFGEVWGDTTNKALVVSTGTGVGDFANTLGGQCTGW